MNDSLNSMGLINRGQLANNAQATLVGKAMAAAHAATYKNQDVEAAYNKVMNTPEARATIDKSLDDIRRAYSNTVSARGGGTEKQESLTFAQAAEVARANAEVFKSEVNDLANPVNGSARITTTDGTPINTVIDSNTGKRVQDPTKSRAFTKAGQRAVDAAEAKQKIAENHAKILASRANAQAKRDAELAASGAAKGLGMKSEEEATAQSEAYQSSLNDSNDSSTGPGEGGSGIGADDTGSTGLGTGTDCLTEDMKVNLNGVVDFITNVKVGDMIDNYKVKEVLHKHMRSGYYAINDELKISKDHPVLANGTWTRPEDLIIGDSINGIPVASLEYVERMTPTVSIVIDGESFDVHTENNIYTVHGRYREVRQEAA